MSLTTGSTIGIKEYKMNGTLYIDGHIISQDCSFTLSVFDADDKHDTTFRHEQVFVGQSLIDSEK